MFRKIVPPEILPALLLLLGVATAVVFAQFLNGFYPLRSWLFFELLAIYGWDLLLTVACASLGHSVITRLLGVRDLPGTVLLGLSLPVGLVGFTLAMYAGGFLALYGAAFSVGLPLIMVLIGFRGLTTDLRRLAIGRAVARGPLLATLFGTLCLGLMYLQIVSPDTVNYDATWYHLVIAQDYAREGRIFRYMANWNAGLPHLASIVQTWSFSVPGPAIDHPWRWMLALHTEFTVFLWTLSGVAAAVDWLSDRRVQGAWAAFFLFPGIFVYDGSLGGAADHFLALFSAPLLLSAGLVATSFAPGPCALLGILAAGALTTKLQAIFLIGPLLGLLFLRLLYLLIEHWRGRSESVSARHLLRGAAILGACTMVLASPHFIKNWIYYRNPLYPMAQWAFSKSHPTMPGVIQMLDYLFVDWHWHPPRQLAERIWQALRLTVMFSFEPHYSFIGNRPNFGSLFTLTLPFIPFVPIRRRLIPAAAVAMGALFAWAFSYWVDRNLQTFLPVMVAITGATIAAVWGMGLPAKLGVGILIALQLVWGVDFYFSGSDRLQAGVALIKSGFDGNSNKRFDEYRRSYRELGQAIPINGLAILHNSHISLGINRRVLLDWIGFQGLIDYRGFKTPREAYDRFAQLGVTHLIVQPGSRAAASKQEEVIFDTLVGLYAKRTANIGGFALYEMPTTPPPDQPPLQVMTIGLGQYTDGVYEVSDLGTCEELPPELQRYKGPKARLGAPETIAATLSTVDAAIVAGNKLDAAATQTLHQTFQMVASYAPFTVYARAPVAH
jgi:hypothetical protein